MSKEVFDHSAGHNSDPVKESLCVQNVETENRNPMNNNGESLDLEPGFGHTIKGFPTDQKDDFADDKTEGTRPMKTIKCEGTENGNMGYDTGTKEKDPFMDNEEYKGKKGAAFDHKDLEYMTDHTDGTGKRVGTKQNAGSGSAIDSVSNEVQENLSGCSLEAEENKNSNTVKAIKTDAEALSDINRIKDIQAGKEWMTSGIQEFGPSNRPPLAMASTDSNWRFAQEQSPKVSSETVRRPPTLNNSCKTWDATETDFCSIRSTKQEKVTQLQQEIERIEIDNGDSNEKYENLALEYSKLQQLSNHQNEECISLRSECTLLKQKISELGKVNAETQSANMAHKRLLKDFHLKLWNFDNLLTAEQERVKVLERKKMEFAEKLKRSIKALLTVMHNLKGAEHANSLVQLKQEMQEMKDIIEGKEDKKIKLQRNPTLLKDSAQRLEESQKSEIRDNVLSLDQLRESFEEVKKEYEQKIIKVENENKDAEFRTISIQANLEAITSKKNEFDDEMERKVSVQKELADDLNLLQEDKRVELEVEIRNQKSEDESQKWELPEYKSILEGKDKENNFVLLKSEKAKLEQSLSKAFFEDGNGRSCANCSVARRVKDMRTLKKGQHISIPGKYSGIYFKPLGKQLSAYEHHAIVIEILNSSHQMAEVILINFWKVGYVVSVCKQAWKFNLQYDELYIIEYQYQRHGPDVIIQRAQNISEQSENGILLRKYNPFVNNCEHFARWCVLGEQKSLQADVLCNDIEQILWNIFGGGNKRYIARLILKVLGNPSAINFPSVGLGVCSAAYLIRSIIKTVCLIKQFKNDKTICWHCLNEKLSDLWLQFGAFELGVGITFAIEKFALPLQTQVFEIPVTFGLVLGTTLTLSVPRIRKALWSQVQYSEKEIMTLSELNPGDVASLTYFGLRHLIIVSEVKWDNNPEQGTVQGIHYSLPALLGTREITEENFRVDLRSLKVNRVEFNTLCTYSPEEVVDRARKRVGERKWNLFFNKSDDFCQWAKIKFEHQCEETSCLENKTSEIIHSRSLSSLLVGKANVHLMNELQLGDAVENGSVKGIITKLEDIKAGRVFYMHMVVRISCLDFRVRLVIDRIDLSKDYLVVHEYHPVHCVSRTERVQKALSMIGKQIPCWTQTGFIEDIILKPRGNK